MAEAALALKLSWLASGIRRAVAERVTLRSETSWSSRGEVCARIRLAITPAPRLVLSYRLNGAPVEEHITLTSTASNLPGNAGRRWWFACPACRRRCAVLYAPRGRWRCRACHHVTYESSCNSDKRASRLLASGGLFGRDWENAPPSLLIVALKAAELAQKRHARNLRRAARLG